MESGLWAGRPRGEVLRALCNAADDDTWECFPSYEFTAFIAGAGRSTAHREIRALEYCALIEVVEPGGGRRRSNRYRINVRLIELCRDRVRAAKKAAVGGKARIAAMERERDYCQLVFKVLERMLRRISAGTATEDAKGKAIHRAIETAETFLKNRPACGRFTFSQTVPLETETVPSCGTKTVHGVDPNLHRSSHSEKTRARGAAAPDGASPPGASRGARGETVPGELRWRARRLIVHWLLTGEVERLKAYPLRDGLADGPPGLACFTGWRIPGYDFDGPEAEHFIANIPATVRREVASGLNWIEAHLAGTDAKDPRKVYDALVASIEAQPIGAKTCSRDTRIDWLRNSLETEDQHPDRAGDHQQAEDAA